MCFTTKRLRTIFIFELIFLFKKKKILIQKNVLVQWAGLDPFKVKAQFGSNGLSIYDGCVDQILETT